MLHCEPTEEQSHHSYRNVHFVSQVTWHQPLTLRNFSPKVGANLTPYGTVASATQQWKNDLIKMYPPRVKPGNGESPIFFSQRTAVNLHFGWGFPSSPCLITEA